MNILIELILISTFITVLFLFLKARKKTKALEKDVNQLIKIKLKIKKKIRDIKSSIFNRNIL